MAPAEQKIGYVHFTSDVGEESCRSLITTVSRLVDEGCDEVQLFFSSTGGRVMSGFTAYNTLRGLPVTLVTHNVGNVDSIGNVMFLAGDRRLACPHSTFMFHGVWWGVEAAQVSAQQAREVLANIEADEHRIAAVIAERTKLKRVEVDKFFKEAATKDATFAEEAGIVHQVADVSIPHGSPLTVIA